MFTIDDINEMLDEIASELPPEVFERLNGGVSLLPDTVLHEHDIDGSLYTLGQYRRDQMGRYIVIYYGSIINAYPQASRYRMKKQLKKVLTHELTHHLESLAGERDLEREDAREIRDYRRRYYN